MSGAELSHSQLMGGEEGICPAWGCSPLLALKVSPKMGASGDLHSPNAGRQLATRSSLEAPAPGKGCTPLSAGDNTPCCTAGNIKMAAVAGRCPKKHQLCCQAGAEAHPASLCQGWTLSLLCHQPWLSPQQDTAPQQFPARWPWQKLGRRAHLCSQGSLQAAGTFLLGNIWVRDSLCFLSCWVLFIGCGLLRHPQPSAWSRGKTNPFPECLGYETVSGAAALSDAACSVPAPGSLPCRGQASGQEHCPTAPSGVWLKPLDTFACYHARRGWEGQEECWVCLLERAEAGGQTDLVLTQLWEEPCSQRDTEPNSRYPCTGAAESCTHKHQSLCAGLGCKLPPPPQTQLQRTPC